MSQSIGTVGSYSLSAGTRIDGNITQFWGTKAKAVAAAKKLAWPVGSVVPCYTRFQKGFGLRTTFDGLMTRTEFERLDALATASPFQR